MESDDQAPFVVWQAFRIWPDLSLPLVFIQCTIVLRCINLFSTVLPVSKICLAAFCQ